MASLVKRPDRPHYYIQYRVGGKLKRRCTHTAVFQAAKQKLRDFENARACGDEDAGPTKTSIADVVTKYVGHIRSRKPDKSAQTETYYLREAFGPICDALKVTSRKLSRKQRLIRTKPAGVKAHPIEADYFEQITSAQVGDFISTKKTAGKLAAKTANHYRQILTRLFNWAMRQGGVRMPGDKNPAARVERFKEDAPEIQFLSMAQIDGQLEALEDDLQLQTMVAMLIYGGLRREEMLWLTPDDIDPQAGPHGAIRIRRKTVDGETWQPKTRKNRLVPISSRLRPYLDKWLLKRGRNQWLFPSPKKLRWEPDNFSADLRAANVTKGVGFKNKHGMVAVPFGCLHFRHTFGSQLAMKGESLYKIAKLMGNSPAIAERHYAALTSDSLTESVEFTSAANGKASSGATGDSTVAPFPETSPHNAGLSLAGQRASRKRYHTKDK